MYKVLVIEKILDKIECNTYGFPTEEQQQLFKTLCEQDEGIIVIAPPVAVAVV